MSSSDSSTDSTTSLLSDSEAAIAEHVLGPVVTGNFDSIDAAYIHLKNHGFQHGWTPKKARQYPTPANCRKQGRDPDLPDWVLYTCNKARKVKEVIQQTKKRHVDKSKRRKGQGSKRKNCGYKIRCTRNKETGKYYLLVESSYHNHRPHIKPTADPVHRLQRQPDKIIQYIKDQLHAGTLPGNILTLLRVKAKESGVENTVSATDIYNLAQKERIRRLGGKSPIQWLLDVSNNHSANF